MKNIALTLTAAAALLPASIVFTGCHSIHSMSPEGADAFDAAAANPAPAAVRPTTTRTTTAPASRAAEYPLTEPVHPSDLPVAREAPLMPIPVPVPRQ